MMIRSGSRDHLTDESTSYPSVRFIPHVLSDMVYALINSSKGLTVATAAIFIVAEMVGSGVLALPKAINDVGIIGFFMLLYCSVSAAFGGTRLGLCWAMIEERFIELQGEHISDPYPTIGEKAFGPIGRVVVRISVYITLFGTSVVFLLLVASMVQDILPKSVPLSYCEWQLIICGVLLPVTWMGSPKDFWFVGIFAILTSSVSCLLALIQLCIYAEDTTADAKHVYPDVVTVFLSFGTILFAFGGASAFPTIQNDMKERSRFPTSVLYAFFVVMGLYLMLSIPGYIVIGNELSSNILESLQPGPLVVASNTLMALHLIMALIIVFNPVAQDAESLIGIPRRFCWQRCLVRSLLMVLAAFIGQTIPQFGKILNLVGASTITILTFIMPNLCYMQLCDHPPKNEKNKFIPLYQRVYMWQIVLVGVVGGIASTYSAILDIVGGNTFVKPCWLSGEQDPPS